MLTAPASRRRCRSALSVVRGQGLELVGGAAKRQAGEPRYRRRGLVGEPHMGIEAGADGGAAQGELVYPVEDTRDAAEPIVELLHVA